MRSGLALADRPPDRGSGERAAEQEVGERVLYVALDRAPQRTGADHVPFGDL